MAGRRAISNVMGFAEQLFHQEMDTHLTTEQVQAYRERGCVTGHYAFKDSEHPEYSPWHFWSEVLGPDDKPMDFWETTLMIPAPKGESPLILARVLSAMEKSRDLVRIRWVNDE